MGKPSTPPIQVSQQNENRLRRITCCKYCRTHHKINDEADNPKCPNCGAPLFLYEQTNTGFGLSTDEVLKALRLMASTNYIGNL